MPYYEAFVGTNHRLQHISPQTLDIIGNRPRYLYFSNLELRNRNFR